MAIIGEITDKAAWQEWIDSRPDCIKQLIKRVPPNRLYRLKTGGGQRVTIYSYAEDGTVTVNISGVYNAVVFERNVFGVNPDDLEECELPEAGEPLGVVLAEDADIDKFVDVVRPIVLANKAGKQ